ncbi:MAG: hypothetical protein ACI9DC_003616 [Gammaproteobacteria bacterium]|jgi:hypothetical protein
MTWVVCVLLALNLALLTWNLQTGTVETTTPALAAPAPGEADQLPLLTELSADALRPRVTALASAVENRERESVDFVQVGNSEPIASTGASTETSVDASSGSNPNQDDTGGIKAERTDESLAVAATQDATHDNMLLRPETDRSVATAESGTAGPALRACLTLGPLTADAPVQEMSRWLTQAGATVDVRTDERREVALYWVFFPPRTSRALAVAEVARLRGEGVTDVIAVPKGDMANAVSLGVFSRTDSRDRRVREMNQRGYQPSVSPRYRVKRASWVDVSALADTLATSTIQARWPGVDVSPKPCASAAVSDSPMAAAGADSNSVIAVEQEASYNASPSAPRRFFFSGSGASRPLQDSETSR